jgi:hypothetical protein
MEMALIFVGCYLLGFFLTLTFFKFFGEKVGMGGYDAIDDRWPDDWDSNESAFIGFSTAWFIVMPALLIVGIFKLVTMISSWYLKL